MFLKTFCSTKVLLVAILEKKQEKKIAFCNLYND